MTDNVINFPNKDQLTGSALNIYVMKYAVQHINITCKIQEPKPKNNGKSTTCYWCGKSTTVLFETLRICKTCNK